jgi:hypothetical protein
MKGDMILELCTMRFIPSYVKLAKIISNHDFKTPKVKMGIEGLGHKVYFKKLCMYSFQGPEYQCSENFLKQYVRTSIVII